MPFLRCLALGLISLLAGSALDAKRPNVLLILTDNQAFDELGCHGHPHVRTPRIDAFEQESVDFLNFHAPPFCSPSRALLLTGRYAMRAGIHNTIGGVSILHRSERTLADLLGAQGYRTAVFGKWHLGYSYPFRPQDRGFQETFTHGGGGIGQLEDYLGNTHLDATYLHNGVLEATKGFSSDVLFSEAMKFIEHGDDKPFFCFVSTPATHRPWQSHPEAARKITERGVQHSKNDLALYSMIENIDENVGKILDQLERLKLTENTLVIVATDQGTRRERDHKGLAYDEYHQVFCLMRYPPLTAGNSHRSTALTGMVDMTPTVLELCGVERPGNLDGRSLRPLLAGRKGWEDERSLIVQCPRGRTRAMWKNSSVKTQRWRLLEGKTLFDAEADPGQLTDLADQHPEVVKKLRRSYERFWYSLPEEAELLSRFVIGAPQTPEIRLNAMDWYRGGKPWHQLHIPQHKTKGGWMVEFVRAGIYRFELRHYPREGPRPRGALKATVSAGGTTDFTMLKPEDEFAIVELEVKKGVYDLEAKFELAGKQEVGALFLYVRRKE